MTYQELCEFEVLYNGFLEARKRKTKKPATAQYEAEVLENTQDLSDDLKAKRHRPGKFELFYVYEPKKRLVQAPSFKDKVVLHTITDNVLYDAITRSFIRDNYASQKRKGTHDGLEMCEPATIKYTGGSSFTCSDKATAQAAAKRTYEAAVELFAYLCKQYNLDPIKDGVIVSHREGHARGIASNHGDPEHLWKGLGMSYTMDTFRAAVKAKMGGTAPAAPTTPPAALATGTTYMVRVKISDLHIRSGPGTNYASKGFIKPGAYTIVEESTGQGAALWGKLKSGAGWIALGYTEKV